MLDFADLYSGGGGAAMGARRAGLRLRWGLEHDARIAAVYAQNLGDHIIVDEAVSVNMRTREGTLPPVFWFHASPPCTTASSANRSAGETGTDAGHSNNVRTVIHALRPRRVSVENVWNYTTYQSFRRILWTLDLCGYAYDYWLLDAADYGVAQNRKRLILVASLDHQPRCPIPTHHNPRGGQLGLLTQTWRGWWSAVQHRVGEFEDDDWAPWQMKRLPAEWRSTFLVGGGNTNKAEGRPGKGVRFGDEPAYTITGSDRRNIRAFLVHGGNGGAAGQRYRYENEPGFTVTAAADKLAHRAYLVSGGDATIRRGDDPAFTVRASPGTMNTTRARLAGRVVRLSVGALADLQDFDRDYVLPPSKQLACRIIGNAVPPGLMQAVIEANI